MKEETADKLLNLVHSNYQEIAFEFSASRQKLVWPEMKKFVSKIKDGDCLLDIGCGNGRLLEFLKDKKINYLGIDNSSKLIKIARQNYPNYKFQEGDILNLSQLPNSHFDYIFCIAVLAHIPSQRLRIKALNELEKKLKNQGLIVLSVWNLWRQIAKKKKYKKLIIKNVFEKIFTKKNLDFGDLIFPWKSSAFKTKEINKIYSQRYYHLFSKRSLSRLIKKTNLYLEKIKKDSFNYWLILRKKKD